MRIHLEWTCIWDRNLYTFRYFCTWFPLTGETSCPTETDSQYIAKCKDHNPWLVPNVEDKEVLSVKGGRICYHQGNYFQFSSVQSLSHVRLFATPWITACQASLSITNSRSLLKLMSIKSVTPSSHLILCRPLLLPPPILPASESFSMSQLIETPVSASASVLPMNTQDWSPLGWTGWISLQSKWLSRVFSNTTVQKHQFFGTQLSSQCNSHIHMWPLEKP